VRAASKSCDRIAPLLPNSESSVIVAEERMARAENSRSTKRLRYRVADRLAATTLAQALRDALTGTAHAGKPEVIWEDRGSQILLHVGKMQVRTLDNVLVVAVDTETAEFGATALIVRFVFGKERDPATLVASSDETVHGDPLVAARWGPLFRGVIWSAVVRLSDAHAAERGLQPKSIAIRKGQLHFAAETPTSLRAVAIAHLERTSSRPAR
jgi:hypothetical protein